MPPLTQPTPAKKAKPRQSLVLRIMRFLWLTFKSIVSATVILLFLTWLLLKIPAVQNWLAQQATAHLSAELNTKVTIEKVEIQLFDKASFKNFYLEDLNKDTLIYAKDLVAHFDISQILKGRFEITAIDLQEGIFQYHRLKGEKDFNLKFFLSYFQPKTKKKKQKAQFALAIQHINIIEGRFHMLDEVAGSEMTVYAPKGMLHAKESNIIGNMVHCDSVWADKAKVKIRIFPGSPLPKIAADPSDTTKFVPINWDVSAGKIKLTNFDFHLLNERIGPKPQLLLDFADLHLQKAEVYVEKLKLKDYTVNANIKQLKTIERRGFQIKSFHGNLMASPTGAYLKDFELQTPDSKIGNELEFEYSKFPDFLDFVRKVKLTARVSDSKVAVKDIMAFAAPLNKVPFFIANKDKTVYLDGLFEGKVDSFQIQDIVMNMNNTHLEGNMTMKPFAKYMTFDIQELETNYDDIRSLLSFTKTPIMLSRLGKIYFSGNFDGYLNKEFKASGSLNSDIGNADIDLIMDPRGGLDNISYDGTVNVGDFDLGKLLDKAEFGKVSAFTNVKGKGMTIAGLDAEVKEGRIDYFEFRGYHYDTISLNGTFTQKRFVGNVKSKDQNFDLDLHGELDFNLLRPVLTVQGEIRKMNFCELNFLTDDLILSVGTVDLRLRGYRIDDFSGRARLKNINFHRGWGDYHIDSVFVGSRDSVMNGDTVRFIRLRSDIASGTVIGKYDMINMPLALRDFAEKYYPNFVHNFGLGRPVDTVGGVLLPSDTFRIVMDTIPFQDLHVKLKLHDSKHLTEIIHPDFKYIKGAEFSLDFDSKEDTFAFNAKVDSLKWAGFKIEKEELKGSGKKDNFNLENSIAHLQLNDSTLLPTPFVKLDGHGDSIDFKIALKEIGKVASNINLNGDVHFNRESLIAKLHNSDLVMLNQNWYVRGDNYFSFDLANKKLKIRNLSLQDSANVQKIELMSYGEKGIQLIVNKFDLGWLYDLVKLPMFDIDGRLMATVQIDDIFKQENLRGDIVFDELVINGDKWNKARLKVSSDNLKDTISGVFMHSGPLADSINAKFFFIPAFATKVKEDKNYVDVNFSAKRAKTRILEYFMVGQLTNTLGFADAKGRIYGKAPNLNIDGLGTIRKLETTFNFLNTRYYIDTAAIVLANDAMSFSPALEFESKTDAVKKGIVLTDQEGNRGYIGGRILHKNLKNWGIDLDLVFNRNLTLNTDAKSNMPFYGKVYATGRANISGPFSKLVMMIDAETNSGPRNEQSTLVLPIMKPVEVNQAIDYLVFKDMKAPIDTAVKTTKPKVATGGIEVIMKIKATPDAVARIIIDEQAGDVIQGSGNGNMQMHYTPSGELFLYGDYEIEKGDYLFTYRNFINKPFNVEKGSMIRWSGDPYNAEVNLKAKYSSKFTLYNLLLSYQEELQNTETRNDANIPVKVDVLMFMTGSLMRPDIKFGLNIDGATQGRAATLASLALRAIQQDESKLNRQVFGLIALNQFLPEENAAANLNIGASSFNTLTEMVSQQFSRYLGDLLSEVVEGSDFITSVDVQVGYKMEDDQLSNAGTGSQFDMSLDNYLFNDKLRIHIGANVDFNNNRGGANQNYVGGDFIVEYAITENGNLKVRAYNRSESSLFGPRVRTGGGLSYQLEFDSFEDLVKEIKANATKAKLRRKAKKEQRQDNREAQQKDRAQKRIERKENPMMNPTD